MMFLLDVNALLAMSYKDHVHHARVDTWASQLLAEHEQDRVMFATCPITELGFVRVGSGPAAKARVGSSSDNSWVEAIASVVLMALWWRALRATSQFMSTRS